MTVWIKIPRVCRHITLETLRRWTLERWTVWSPSSLWTGNEDRQQNVQVSSPVFSWQNRSSANKRKDKDIAMHNSWCTATNLENLGESKSRDTNLSIQMKRTKDMAPNIRNSKIIVFFLPSTSTRTAVNTRPDGRKTRFFVVGTKNPDEGGATGQQGEQRPLGALNNYCLSTDFFQGMYVCSGLAGMTSIPHGLTHCLTEWEHSQLSLLGHSEQVFTRQFCSGCPKQILVILHGQGLTLQRADILHWDIFSALNCKEICAFVESIMHIILLWACRKISCTTRFVYNTTP